MSLPVYIPNTRYTTEDLFYGFSEYLSSSCTVNNYVPRKWSDEELKSWEVLKPVLLRWHRLFDLIRDLQKKIETFISESPFNYPKEQTIGYCFEFQDGIRLPDRIIQYWPKIVLEHNRLYKRDLKERMDRARDLYNALDTLHSMTAEEFNQVIQELSPDPDLANYRTWAFHTYGKEKAI